MTRTTSELRAIYSPACTSKHRIGWREAWTALDAIMKKWKYAPKPGQTGSQNCRKITGGSGYSLHSYFDDETFTFWSGVRVSMALAVDINWNTNPYGHVLHTDMPRGMVDEIVAIRTNSGAQVWRWGGYYAGNKDAMHYEIVASPGELKTGIAGGVPVPEEDDMPVEYLRSPDKKVWATVKGFGKTYVAGKKDMAARGIKASDIKPVKANDPRLAVPDLTP